MSSGPSAVALAEEAYGLVQADPQAAAALAERALTAARVEGDPRGEITALHALAWAQHVLGDNRAIRTARKGIRIGARAGDRVAVALLRRRLSIALAFAGDIHGARREIDAAIAALSGLEAARSEVFRLAVLRAAPPADVASHREALTRAAVALRRLVRDGDEIWQARLLFNRGAFHLDRGDLHAAELDLRSAETLYARLGARAAAADAAVALAEVALFRGDLLEYLRVSDAHRAALPAADPATRWVIVRASALAQLRLLPEARVAADEYIELCRRGGRDDMVAAAQLDLAAIAILDGTPETAREAARAAARSLTARGKPIEAALAQLIVSRAELAGGPLGRPSLARSLAAAGLLERSGWGLHAGRAHLVAAQVAIALHRLEVASDQLRAAQGLSRRGTAPDRIELAYVTALLHAAHGRNVPAVAMLRRGVGLLEEYRASFGAFELRSTISEIGDDLVRLGQRLALADARTAAVLEWSELTRAAALRLPPVRPPADPELRRAQSELRQIASRIRAAEGQGTLHARLVAQQRKLERIIRERARYVAASGSSHAHGLDRASLTRAAAKRVLVEYAAVDDRLVALVLRGGRLTMHELQADGIETELGWLRFSLAQVARRSARSPSSASVTASAQALDDLLLAPLRPLVGDAPLVVVPTGPLHALPWASLPSLRGRPVVVAPSFTTWLELATRPRSRRHRVVLAAGPRLRHARRELQVLAPLTPTATVLRGRAATVAAALGAFEGAAIAHVACHGRFRADNPLFSSLELTDGPLTALDLQQLRRVPDVFVLSACDLALSERHPGDELLGFAAALLAMGTRTIIASVVPVPDAASRRMMVAFHQALNGGAPPAVALARSQATEAVPGFVCLGSG